MIDSYKGIAFLMACPPSCIRPFGVLATSSNEVEVELRDKIADSSDIEAIRLVKRLEGKGYRLEFGEELGSVGLREEVELGFFHFGD